MSSVDTSLYNGYPTRRETSQLTTSQLKGSAEQHLPQRVWSLFEKVIWEFVNQGGRVVRQTFKAIVIQNPEYGGRLSKAIACIGFMSGVSLLLTIKSFPKEMANWYENVSHEDLEGGILGTLNLLATLGSMLDDVSTFSGSLTALGAIPKIAFFGLIGLPLAMGLLSYAIVNKSYSLYHQGQFITSLPKEIQSDNLKEFIKFIDERMDDSDEKLKSKKIRVLSRHSDPKVVAIMGKLKEHLEKKPRDIEVANLALNDMKTLMKRKITLGAVATGTNIAMLTALAVSILCPPAAIAVPAVAALKATITISTHAYKTFWFESGLKSMERMVAATAA